MLIIGLLTVLVILVAGLFVGQTLLERTNGTSVSPIAHHKIEKLPSPSTTAILSEAAKEPAPDVASLPPEPQSPAAEPSTVEATAPTAMAATVALVPQPPVRDLEQVIKSKDTLNSRIGALTAVLKEWNALSLLGSGPMEVVDSDTFFRISARHNDLEALRVQGNLILIKNLNLPAILEFSHPDGSGPRFLAVVGLADDEIQLSDGDDTFSVAPVSLAGLWNGVAHIFWKNYYNYAGVIPISSPGEVILSLKVHLKALGFPIEEMTPAYDTTTRLAVEVIQARNGLDVDGMVGPLTKIALYNEDKLLNIPRLAAARMGDGDRKERKR
ncbi:MAG: peptidoglycan-binding protein [Desulfosarcina sp.]|nr:peptidoglycan-binding protein [Desulfosarcina sp.]MBC2766413.1 peptidoglycan-binding protein [Desulfosarcina sp.]